MGATVHTPEVQVLGQPDGAVELTVYFMRNRCLEIIGHVTRGMGKTKLWIKPIDSPSGAVASSVCLRKVRYPFEDAQGSSKEFEFAGSWPPARRPRPQRSS